MENEYLKFGIICAVYILVTFITKIKRRRADANTRRDIFRDINKR